MLSYRAEPAPSVAQADRHGPEREALPHGWERRAIDHVIRVPRNRAAASNSLTGEAADAARRALVREAQILKRHPRRGQVGGDREGVEQRWQQRIHLRLPGIERASTETQRNASQLETEDEQQLCGGSAVQCSAGVCR